MAADEREFQRLFEEHRALIALALPVAVPPDTLRPAGRPGQSEADFEIIVRTEAHIEVGVVELKRADAPVLTSPRQGIVRLTAAAETAAAQARTYADRLARSVEPHEPNGKPVSVTVARYVIMGTTRQLRNSGLSGMSRARLRQAFPDDVRFIPYDLLLARYRLRSAVQRALQQPEPFPRFIFCPPKLRDNDPERPIFGLPAVPALLQRIAGLRVCSVSIYRRSSALASLADFAEDRPRTSDDGIVYLLYDHRHKLEAILAVDDGRVVWADVILPRDEHAALRAAGAGQKLRNATVDDERQQNWVRQRRG